jgi:hypothetical protein
LKMILNSSRDLIKYKHSSLRMSVYSTKKTISL